MLTLQLPVPVQAPPQPAKVESLAGLAVSVTPVPLLYSSEQSVPQVMPAGLLVTVPLPFPGLVTVRVNRWIEKVAVQVLLAVMVTTPAVQSGAPLQPAKMEPLAGVAVSVTTVPLAYDSKQSVPQVIPGGLLVTVPLPLPALVIVRVRGTKVKVAVTDLSSSMLTVQLLVPVQAPFQPAKVESLAGLAVRVTTVSLE